MTPPCTLKDELAEERRAKCEAQVIMLEEHDKSLHNEMIDKERLDEQKAALSAVKKQLGAEARKRAAAERAAAAAEQAAQQAAHDARRATERSRRCAHIHACQEPQE